MHGSLQFFAFGLFSLFSTVFKDLVNAWNAQFDSDSRVPSVVFSDDFGNQKLFRCSFFAILSCWRALGHPSGPHRASRAEKDQKGTEKETQLETILGPLASFGQLGCSFGCPRAQKERPASVRVRFTAKRKNMTLIWFSACFWSLGPPGRSPKAFLGGQFGANWGSRGLVWADLCGFFPRLNFEVDF